MTQQLRVAINNSLANCLRSATPNVCELAETKDGYQQVERMIISTMADRKVSPDEAIIIIEDLIAND